MSETKKSNLKHLIYTSKPVDYEKSGIDRILSQSQKNNSNINVTGLLIFGPDMYLQLLEGYTDSVDKTFEKIAKDDRHIELKILKESMTDQRLFSSWTMRPQDLRVLMWSQDEKESRLINNLSEEKALNIFKNISTEFDLNSNLEE